MMSQPGKKTIAIYTSFNISRILGNQAIKFGQLVECNRRFFFLKNISENKAGILVPDLFLFFKKAIFGIKASCLQLIFNII